MYIGYLRIPHFAVSVAQRDDSSLAKQQHLILIEETTNQARVYAACERALACGVQPGMGLAQAQRLCPEACLAPACESVYLETFEACLDVLRQFVSRVEPETLGNAYLDLRDVARGPAEALDFHQALAGQLHRDQRLVPSMGVTETMFGAAVASFCMQPGQAFALPAGVERGFLSGFPTRVLPLSSEMQRRLQLLGLRLVGQYADLPSGVILNQFGWEGQRAHRLACGEDDRRVHPHRPRLAETANHQFVDPIADATVLAVARDRLVSQLVSRLQERYLASQAMYLRLWFEVGPACEVWVILPAPTAHQGELQRAADRLTRKIPIASRVTEIGVSLSKLVPLVGRQLALFPIQAEQERRLRQTLTNLASRYGQGGFRQPVIVDADSLALEQRFVLARWDDE